MRRKIRLIFLLIIGLSNMAQAEILNADSLICESDSFLEVLDQENLKNQTGSVVIKRVDASAQFYRLQAKGSALFKELAVKEERIRADTRVRGSSSAQASAASDDQRDAEAKAEVYERFLKHCMATDARDQPAVVLETRAISRTYKIRTIVNGIEAEVWTKMNYLRK